MGCSVGFKYAKNALAAGAPPWTPLGELTLPQTSYSTLTVDYRAASLQVTLRDLQVHHCKCDCS